MLLSVEQLSVRYGGIQAISDVSFHVDEGEIVTLIGANGAGKSTCLRAISGLVKPDSGSIWFGQDCSGSGGRGAESRTDMCRIPPYKAVQLGISHVPEGRHVFSEMTVRENLELGAFTRKDAGGVESDIQRVYRLFPRLKERSSQRAGTLSGGEQQMLATARGLMCRPRLILLDEPSMGLAPLLVREIFEIIQEINSQGTTVLLVEQNASMALSIAKRAYVLENGRVCKEGNSKDLSQDPQVKAAYLGGN